MKPSALFALPLLLLLAWAAPGRAEDSLLIPFALKDQNGKAHTHDRFLQGVVILIGSDRAGSKYNETWGKALGDALRRDSLLHKVAFLGVADTRGVPGFLRGMVRHSFPDDRTVLMDWDGLFAKAYRFEAKATNILIFAPGGKRIRQYACRQLDPARLKDMIDRLKAQPALR